MMSRLSVLADELYGGSILRAGTTSFGTALGIRLGSVPSFLGLGLTGHYTQIF